MLDDQFTALGTLGSIPSDLIGPASPVVLQATVAVHFAADRRR